MSEQSRTLLGGRYELDHVIGRGGMAEVWKARDSRLGRDVAVKRLRVDLATDPTFQARFRREAQSAAGLNHPNIVATYDTGEEVDEKAGIHVPYIVMELVEGHTLRDLLREDRRIRPELALEFSQGVLDALAYSHKAGIIHRDIKPANVMITPTGRVKVMDFGIARAVADTSATMTQTAAVIGTAQYLSPEQARGEQVDNRSDVYAAGCLLYELLAGRPPFVGDSPVSVAYQHVREMPAPPSALDPELTPAMDAIVLKSLAKDPADRYQDAKEMRDDIARLLAGQPVHAAPLVAVPVPDPTAVTQVVHNAGAPTTVGAAAAGAAAASQNDTLVGQTGELEPVEEQRRRRNPMAWIIVFLLAALVGLVTVGIYSFTRPNDNTGMVPVTNYETFSETQATSLLQRDQFKVAVVRVNGPDGATVGTVTKQQPNSGTALKGSTVTITVNDGPKTSKVPNVLGMSADEAKKALVEAGFSEKLIAVEDAKSEQEMKDDGSWYDKGQVAAVNPAEGADWPASGKVTLSVATGKSPVPNILGMSQSDAEKAAKAVGLTIRWGDPVEDNQSIDKVSTQDPASGSIDRSKSISASLGKKEQVQTAKVPNLSGLTQADAVKLVKEYGFTSTVEVREVAVTDEAQNGLVADQTPKADSSQPLTQVITIFVGKYTAPPSTAPAEQPAEQPAEEPAQTDPNAPATSATPTTQPT